MPDEPLGHNNDGSSAIVRFLPSGDEAGSAPEDRAFRPDVEGLRAVAIVLVVLFHVGLSSFRGGLIGVDVFFVISGFVITGLLLRERAATGSTGFSTFYARRARRILPAAILVIVVSLIATDIFASARTTALVANDSRWTALFLSNFHFASVMPNLFSVHPNNLNHFWSLAVEEQFYLFYPAFFVLLLSIPGPLSIRKRLCLGLTVVIAISFVGSVMTSKVGNLAAYYSPFTRAWELGVGCLMALGTRQFRKIPQAQAAAISWIGIGGILLAAMFVVSFRIPYPGYAAALPVLGAALVIVGGGAAPRWGAEAVLGTLAFRWIGRWSYSWYLWQPVAFSVAFEHGVGRRSIPTRLLLALLTLVVAAISYFLVENPIRHSKKLARNPRASLIGAALLVASCVAFTFAF